MARFRLRAPMRLPMAGGVSVAGDVDMMAIPSYVPTTSFQARALSGAYTPTNGNELMASVVGSDWKDPENYPLYQGHLSITAYSGGFSDPTRGYLYAHGGGHGDSAYNGILRYDLNGTNAPTGWTLVGGSESAVVDVPTTQDVDHTVYDDGKAGSIHSYDNLGFDAPSNRLQRWAGSYWRKGTGGGRDGDWRFDFNTGAWTNIPCPFSKNGDPIFGATVESSAHRKALRIAPSFCRFFNYATEEWGAAVSAPGTGLHMIGALDPTRERGLYHDTDALKHTIIDWSAETISAWQTASVSGATEVLTNEAPGIFYDALLDRFWLLGPRSIAFDKLYWIDAADFADNSVTVYSQSLSGDTPIQKGSIYFGLFKRFCYMPDWRAVAVWTTYEYPPYVIKLPSA